METARPTAHETGGVRARALAAATEILAAHGQEALSLRAIAEAAGVGIASIYHYFAGKEDLLLSLARMGFEDLRVDMLRQQAGPDAGSPMRAGHRAFFGFVRDQPALFSLMFSAQLLARHPELREAEHRAYLAYEAAVRADRRIPPPHQESAAFAIWALGRGMAAVIASYPSGAVPEDVSAKLFAGALYLIDHGAGDGAEGG